MKYTKDRSRYRNWDSLSSLLCYVDIDHSDRCFRRYLLHNLSLPELLCRRSSVVVASESDSWLRGGWAGMVASSLRCQREHDSAGLGSAQPSRSHSLARAATSSTALHWVESRHCTALHCTSIMILQNIFQLDKPCCSAMLSLLQSQQHSVILK